MLPRNKAVYATYKAREYVLRDNIRICDDWIKSHNNFINKHVKYASQSSSAGYRARCIKAINVRKVALTEHKKKKALYAEKLNRLLRKMSSMK